MKEPYSVLTTTQHYIHYIDWQSRRDQQYVCFSDGKDLNALAKLSQCGSKHPLLKISFSFYKYYG